MVNGKPGEDSFCEDIAMFLTFGEFPHSVESPTTNPRASPIELPTNPHPKSLTRKRKVSRKTQRLPQVLQTFGKNRLADFKKTLLRYHRRYLKAQSKNAWQPGEYRFIQEYLDNPPKVYLKPLDDESSNSPSSPSFPTYSKAYCKHYFGAKKQALIFATYSEAVQTLFKNDPDTKLGLQCICKKSHSKECRKTLEVLKKTVSRKLFLLN